MCLYAQSYMQSNQKCNATNILSSGENKGFTYLVQFDTIDHFQKKKQNLSRSHTVAGRGSAILPSPVSGCTESALCL